MTSRPPSRTSTTTLTSFAGSTATSETGSPAKRPRCDEDSSEGGSGSALELADELAFDPFVLLQMPYSGGYDDDSLDGLFAADEAVQQDVGNGMDGVRLWSFDEFPAVDGSVF
ncbi:Ethylene-responsive transcription factor RAP2-3 [Zea mays]|uniref:Ethylene-responsive transcription factor RAP2-3 n=1 Tax=Zea mays TaxID=4577 RepID=A0A1D6JQP6_MAIZE|nr:Ethylene-responsive transcription factor RAP2-3 [Zea mays]